MFSKEELEDEHAPDFVDRFGLDRLLEESHEEPVLEDAAIGDLGSDQGGRPGHRLSFNSVNCFY